MLSYFAAIEKSPNARERSTRLFSHIISVHPNYKPCFKSEGSFALVAGETSDRAIRIYKLANSQGLVMGRLFHRSSQSAAGHVPDQLSEHESSQIAGTLGRHLIDTYWGRYAAFINNTENQKRVVVSDPSGSMPIYYFETDAYVLLFSNGSDFHDLGLTALSFNTDRILSHIKTNLYDYNNTGFNEIKKVNRGSALIVSEEGTHVEQYWHPRQFVEKSKTWGHEEAATLLHDTIVQCVGAWGSVFDRIGISLSGGLDSSIVLAALRKAAHPPTTIASHVYFPSSAESDERRWACEIAERAGIEIHCTELCSEDIDPTTLRDFDFNAEPINCMGSVMSGPRNRQFIDRYNVGALLSGHGGDMIFAQGAAASAEDYVWNHGWNWGALRCIAENALVTRTSFYDALATTVRSRRCGRSLNLNALMKERSNSIVNSELFNSLDLNKHCAHWLSGLEEISIGKAVQLTNSWCTQHHYVPNREDWEIPKIHPLLSQPVIEAIARIPTYLFCLNGIDRGLARYAFRRDVPHSIISRQSKGTAHDYYEDLYTHHLDFFKESLSSGALMQLGLLDTKALERAFAIEISAESTAKYNVLDLIDVEHWARWWKSRIDNQREIKPI